ncbi:uncharacterized protein TrAtP1_006702 [Trichoderma atroviride]|uniref:uncharacterized protein n=1 Tax=Hypocrea atroviridis TaxID=63577 RepID=UPI00331B83B8|nr:hypothetical protein TrAtP1_006702 [Trichoderma atroviride]
MDSRDSRAPSRSKQERSDKSYEEPNGSNMDTDPVSCNMASAFYEIMRDSGLQRQLEHGWGNSYAHDGAADSASSPTSDFGDASRSDQSRSRQSSKVSSPLGSRRVAQRRDGKRLKSPKSKTSGGSQVKEEDEEESMEDIQPMPESGNPYSLKYDAQAAATGEDHRTSGYKLNREDYADREYLRGLDSELDTLRKHLLQRANPPRSFP